MKLSIQEIYVNHAVTVTKISDSAVTNFGDTTFIFLS
jgi:hypothetical protein